MESLLNMFDYPLVVNRVKSTMNTKSRLVGQGNLPPEPEAGNIELVSRQKEALESTVDCLFVQCCPFVAFQI